MKRHATLLALLALCTCRGETTASPHMATSSAAELATSGPPTSTSATIDEPAPTILAGLPLRPASGAGSMSAGAVALGHVGTRALAFVADADDRALVTFDLDARTRLASTPLPARPSAVLVLPSGRVAVLGADDAQVHLMVLTAIDAPLVGERAVRVPAEPVAASLTPSGLSLLVVSRWGHALSVVPIGPGEPAVFDLPRDPSAVVASADGKRAVVMHAAGSRASVVELEAANAAAVTAVPLDRRVQRELFDSMMMMPMAMPQEAMVDLDGPANAAPRASQVMPAPKRRVPPKPRFESVTLRADQAFGMVRTDDDRVLSPEVLVDTGPAAPSGGYGASSSTVTPAIVSFSGSTGRLLGPGGDRTPASRCLLPRGAALDVQGRRMLVACLGTDALAVFGVKSEATKLQRLVSVPKGPVAVAVDTEGQRAIVWSAFARALSVVDLSSARRPVVSATLEHLAAGPSPEVVRGRSLFHSAFDARVSSDGRACASCHPDGRDDGLTWSSPNGPMQTPMLFSRLEGTAPYGWDGAAKDLRHHLSHTTARLGGGGLSASDVADVSAYLTSLEAPAPAVPEPARVARGAELFHSVDVGCSECHAGDALTDGDTHDVKSGSTKRARTFDTPSLRFIARSAPYFHDGRFATLSDMLSATDGAMGHTAQLSEADRTALTAYLETL